MASILAVPLLASAAAPFDEPFRPKGVHNNSVHRFFPDLDARLNAVRYGRWRGLEIAWTVGINPELDREFSTYLRRLLANPPRFAPEAERVAPTFAREAVPVFHALHWGQMLEQQLLDALASPDASPALTAARLDRALVAYRRERWALTAPEPAPPPSARVIDVAPVSAQILISGTRLFALAAQDLVVSDFGRQRWKVRETVQTFDKTFLSPRSIGDAWYAVAAPGVVAQHSVATEPLDRVARFRLEVFQALIPGGATPAARRERNENLRAVARRYGLLVEGIDGH
jgi:hypothetical protein